MDDPTKRTQRFPNQPAKAANQKAAKFVRMVTKGMTVKGESLLGSADLKRQLREAKKRR